MLVGFLHPFILFHTQTREKWILPYHTIFNKSKYVTYVTVLVNSNKSF